MGGKRSRAQDYGEAVQWCRKAAELGDAKSMFSLALIYGLGEGVPRDFSEAYVWFSVASASGYDAGEQRDVCAKKLRPEALRAAKERARVLFEEIEARKAGK